MAEIIEIYAVEGNLDMFRFGAQAIYLGEIAWIHKKESQIIFIRIVPLNID